MRAQLPRAVLLWTASAPLPLLSLSLDGRISRLDGGLLLVWFAVALTGVVRGGRRILSEHRVERTSFPLVRLLAGLAALSVGGELLGEGIKRAVARFGVSQTLLGNTVVAASVEAEEVARVAVPTRRGGSEIGLANIAGTIVHFITFNAGVIALVKPIHLDDASRYLHAPVAAAATLLACGVIWSGQGIGRRAGAALLTAYAAYLAAAITVAAT
jgi:cation:H+ antiporter